MTSGGCAGFRVANQPRDGRPQSRNGARWNHLVVKGYRDKQMTRIRIIIETEQSLQRIFGVDMPEAFWAELLVVVDSAETSI